MPKLPVLLLVASRRPVWSAKFTQYWTMNPLVSIRLELRLREAIGAVKRVRDSGLGNKRLNIQLSRFEKYCKSLLGTIVGHPQ
jgi:hypothetical protein